MVARGSDCEFICFLDQRAADRFDLAGANVRPVIVLQRVSPTEAAAAESARSPADMLRFTRAVHREHPDVFFSPSVYTYFPLPPGQRAVVTIHDAIAERFPELTLPSTRARLFWKAKVSLALWQARLVLTVSPYAARELVDVLHCAPERIRLTSEAPAAIYLAAPSQQATAAAALRAGLPPGARWFIYIGGFNPHKHIDLLVRAHGAIAASSADAPWLLLVGARSGDGFHGAQAAIEQAIRDSGAEARVKWTGFVADEELRHLLAGAIAVVLPSASEGFGLPAVEGAATGAPVIATTASPLPELLEGGGIFVPPGELEPLTAAMRQLLADEPARRAMGARAHEMASRLSWDTAAESALAALREAAQ